MNRKQSTAAIAAAAGMGVALLSAPASASTVTLLQLPSGATSGSANGINDKGVIVGSAHTATGTSPVRWTAAGTPQKLSVPAGAAKVWANDVNEAGVIVGDGGAQSFRWAADGTRTLLPVLAGSVDSDVIAINDGGVAIGQSLTSGNHTHTTRWAADGTPAELPGAALGTGINNAGAATGIFMELRGGAWFMRSTRWAPDGAMTVLPTPAGDDAAMAMGINGSGVIVGATGVSHSSGAPMSLRAARWNPDGSVTPLPCLPAAASPTARTVSEDAAALLGRRAPVLKRVMAGGAPLALPSGARKVTLAADDCLSQATAVNDDGVIVGTMEVAAGVYRSVRWNTDGTVTMLGAVDPSRVNSGGVVAGRTGDPVQPVRWTG